MKASNLVPKVDNGDDGIRTHDLCSAIAALSQLSYIPGDELLYLLR
jgi:hypothetical protein